MDKTDRISFSKTLDLAGQNKLVKDPGQVYIAKTINTSRFLVDFGIFWGSCGDDLGMFWVVPRHVLARTKSTYLNLQKIYFLKIGVPCAA